MSDDNQENLQSSFSAADSFPVKLLLNDGIGDLSPVHVQWLPTNQCNLLCKFCSCSERDRTLEMDLAMAKRVIKDLAALGTKAVTITGGGEPLCHPRLAEMVDWFVWQGIEVGLVTNGLLLRNFSPTALDLLRWCRISHSDYRTLKGNYESHLDSVVREHPGVDWAFSYVAGKNPVVSEIRDVVNFANEHGFTHVRIVADLTCPDEVDLGPVKVALKGVDQKVIYQSRSEPVPASRCTVGYVKPLISPDFKVYLCCGVQYALEKMSLDLPEELCMGSALELGRIYSSRKPVEVSCVRCYYRDYNYMLEPLTREIKHKEFV